MTASKAKSKAKKEDDEDPGDFADEIELDPDDAARMNLIQDDIDHYVEADQKLREQWDLGQAQINDLNQKMGQWTADRLKVQGAAEGLENAKLKMAMVLEEKYNVPSDIEYELRIREGKMVRLK